MTTRPFGFSLSYMRRRNSLEMGREDLIVEIRGRY